MTDALVEVAALAPLRPTLTYRALPGGSTPAVGCRVLVPLGSRQVVGVVVGHEASSGNRAPGTIKAICDVLDVDPLLDTELLDFARWVARYYMAPLGEVLRAALPAALQARERQVVRLTDTGARALAAQQALLRRPGEQDLTSREATLLQRLSQSPKGCTRRQLAVRGELIARLLRRGLVEQTAHRRLAGRTRTELVVELIDGGPTPVAAAALARAPAQAALVAALAAAGGRAPLGALDGAPAGARVLASKLAARGIVQIETVEVPRDPFAGDPVAADQRHILTAEQQVALDALLAGLRGERYAAFLLHGVTGSGKTEVYLRLIEEALHRERAALVLVPEIALTPQLAARFRARFGDQVAVLHSGLTDAERYEQWRLIRAARVRIVVGARSALFAPVQRLGAVIVDEEHDGSFKQEEGLRYNARDMALVRAQRAGAVAVLGSATPALETRHSVEEGRLSLLTMAHRATPKPLPAVEVIDLRTYSTGPERVLSAPLAQALSESLERREQAILFLNRRGYSPFVLCRSCGHVFRCEHCSVSLTHHQSVGRLLCHYCGYAVAPPEQCPSCACVDAIGMLGLGTERVEGYLQQRFPGARVARLDRDSASGKGLRSILGRFTRHEIDILVGTQMVTKGHDFPQVTLVGVICADLGLHFPDFRAAERTFQLLTQVAGRAGRGERPGRVLIQTYNVDHPSIRWACQHDYDSFFRQELRARREVGYPPCAHLAAIWLDGTASEAVATHGRELAAALRRAIGDSPVTLLGPAEAPIQRLKGRTRWLMLLKSPQRAPLRRVLEAVQPSSASGAVRVVVDIDPVRLL